MSAYYENLPVYRKAHRLSAYLDEVVCHFAKRHKYNAGDKLLNLSLDVLLLIAEANKKTERKECLRQVIVKLEKIKILLHHCKEVKAFNNFHSFEVATKLVVNVSKQCEGWYAKSQSSSTGQT